MHNRIELCGTAMALNKTQDIYKAFANGYIIETDDNILAPLAEFVRIPAIPHSFSDSEKHGSRSDAY